MYTTMFRLPRTRNPLLRALGAIAGVLIVAAVLVFGFFIALALVAIGAVIWAVRQFSRPSATTTGSQQPASSAPPTPPGVIEGEFTVVRERSSSNSNTR